LSAWRFDELAEVGISRKASNIFLSEVIGACDARIREGGVIRNESKNDMVRLMEAHAPATIVWTPSTERGWGASAFNKNCWRTVEGEPILPLDAGKAEKKIKDSPPSSENAE
jgi:hypothetical protein